jgi:hypothetical protein
MNKLEEIEMRENRLLEIRDTIEIEMEKLERLRMESARQAKIEAIYAGIFIGFTVATWFNFF